MPTDTDPLEQEARARQADLRIEQAIARMEAMLLDDWYMTETPIEVIATMEEAIATLVDARGLLAPPRSPAGRSAPTGAAAPTARQGQFLAFIRDHLLLHDGVAPTHAELQQFFRLTPPSVSAMLARLEERGFIRRRRGQARGIELTIDPASIPPLQSRPRG